MRSLLTQCVLFIYISTIYLSAVDAVKCKTKSFRRMVQMSCSALGSSCNEDCECCENDQQINVRCEHRNKQSGYKCYKSAGLGGKCEVDSDCTSQKCENKLCVKFRIHDDDRVMVVCPITDFLSVAAVKGTRQENICDCDDPSDPVLGDALKAVDGKPRTVYENNWAIGGGIEVRLKDTKRLKSLEICNSADCIECDPTCYKLEGYCDMKGIWETIQEGDLLMPLERNECVTVQVSSIPLYSNYSITFPCQRGTCRDSCEGDCHAVPVQNPKIDSCPTSTNAGPSYGNMTLISREYQPADDRTLFSYTINNVDLIGLTMSWLGDCRIEYYYVYEDVNGNQELDSEDVCCWRQCGNDFTVEDDECMDGLMIWTSSFLHGSTPGIYFLQLYVSGEPGVTELPYLAKKEGAPTQGGIMESPVCPQVLCPATCPLKVSKITLYTKECDEVVGIAGSS